MHAAAVACRAHYLVTDNLRDFDPGNEHLSYEPMSSDTFFCLVDDYSRETVQSVVRKQMDHWCRHRGEADLARYLEKARCPTFAARVRRHIAQIGGIPFS